MNEHLDTNKFNLSFIPAESAEEYKELVRSKPKDMIKSLEEFHSFKKETESFNFESIEPNLLEKFEQSLIFHNGGLGGAYYGDLSDTLTFRQFRELFARFGVGLRFFCDREDQICFIDPGFPHSCKPENDQFCNADYCPDC